MNKAILNKISIFLSLFSILICAILSLMLSGCQSTGIKPLNKKLLSQNQMEYRELIPVTNTFVLVQPKRTVTVEIPKEEIRNKSISNDVVKLEIDIPAITNTFKVVDNKSQYSNKSFYTSGSFLLIWYSSVGLILGMGYLIWKMFIRKRKTVVKQENKV